MHCWRELLGVVHRKCSMDQMPTGWMSADEARKWARRGVWAYRSVVASWMNAIVLDDANAARDSMEDAENWRYLCAHPGDLDAAPAVETVEVEAWVALDNTDDGTDLSTFVCADEPAAERIAARATLNGRVAHVVRIVANVPLPTRVEPVTVRGEVKS